MLEIFFETYGCTANYNSTEIMKGLVRQAGLNITEDENFADLIVINSCIVKTATQEKIRRKIQDLLKKNKKIILAGCMPRLNSKIFPEYQERNLFFLDTTHVKDLISLIKDIQENNYLQEKYLKWRKEIKLNLPKIPKEKLIGVTQISEGCLGNCTYCITRLAKGRLFSYPKDEIIKSIKNDLGSGCKEIWLTSQDCASYGNDAKEFLLPELLQEICKAKKNFKLRAGMMNPNNVLQILPELIQIYKDKKIYKFLHLPIQSGSNRILKAMNRYYKKEDIKKIIKEFRKEFPEIHISTDVIVGYPGETEKDFNETYELVKFMNPETINISKFGKRPGTRAEKLEEISPGIMRKRTSKLAQLHKKLCNENQKKFLEKEFEVFANQKGFGNTYLARDENYKLFAVISKEKILGKKVKVKVKKLTPHYLISEMVI